MARICIFNSDADKDTRGADINHRSLANAAASRVYSKPVRLPTPGLHNVSLEFLWSSGRQGSAAANDLTLRFFLEYNNDRPALATPPAQPPADLTQRHFWGPPGQPDPTAREAVRPPNVLLPGTFYSAGVGYDPAGGPTLIKIVPQIFCWSRECSEEVSSTLSDYVGYGVSNERLVNHYPLVRQLVLPANDSDPTVELNRSAAYLPLVVHGMWFRLALWYSGTALDFTRQAARTWITDGVTYTTLGGWPDNQLIVFAHVGGHSEEQYLEENEFTPYAYNA